MPAPKTCSRPGCDKTLKPNNQKGMYSSGCLSPEAPISLRAAVTDAPGGEEDVLVRFRRVCKALGKDPNQILDGAMRKVAEQWLQAIEDAVR